MPQSALSQLLETFRAGDGVDPLHESVRVALQELFELEATGHIGAAPYERTEDRTKERNGHLARMLNTKTGDVVLRFTPHYLDHLVNQDIVEGFSADRSAATYPL